MLSRVSTSVITIGVYQVARFGYTVIRLYVDLRCAITI